MISASVSPARSTVSTVRSYSSGPADAIMSTGFATEGTAGKSAWSRARVNSLKRTTESPAASHASAARMPGPPALVTMATRPPRGNGCADKHAARSNISSIVSARITPV